MKDRFLLGQFNVLPISEIKIEKFKDSRMYVMNISITYLKCKINRGVTRIF